MRHLWNAAAALPFLFVLPVVVGCGDDAKVGAIQTSPEAKKADEGTQKGMQDFMGGKGQSKSKSKSR